MKTKKDQELPACAVRRADTVPAIGCRAQNLVYFLESSMEFWRLVGLNQAVSTDAAR